MEKRCQCIGNKVSTLVCEPSGSHIWSDDELSTVLTVMTFVETVLWSMNYQIYVPSWIYFTVHWATSEQPVSSKLFTTFWLDYSWFLILSGINRRQFQLKVLIPPYTSRSAPLFTPPRCFPVPIWTVSYFSKLLLFSWAARSWLTWDKSFGWWKLELPFVWILVEIWWEMVDSPRIVNYKRPSAHLCVCVRHHGINR